MALSIDYASGPQGGPIAGALMDAFLDTSRYQILLYNSAAADGTAWAYQGISLPVAPLWSYGIMPTAQRVAAVLATVSFVPSSALPPLGGSVLNVAVAPVNRLSTPTLANGAVTGTVTGLASPTSYRVRVYGWMASNAWVRLGSDATPTPSNSWSVPLGTPPPTGITQYAAVLMAPPTQGAPAEVVPPGTLPRVGVVNTRFSGVIAVGFGTVPAVVQGSLRSGGLLSGGVRGIARAHGLTAIVYVLRGTGASEKVTSFDFAEVQPNGTWSFPAVLPADNYAVAVARGLTTVPLTRVPRQGGSVVAVARTS